MEMGGPARHKGAQGPRPPGKPGGPPPKGVSGVGVSSWVPDPSEVRTGGPGSVVLSQRWEAGCVLYSYIYKVGRWAWSNIPAELGTVREP